MKKIVFLLLLLALQVAPAHAQEDARLFLRDVYLTYVEGDGEGVPLTGAGARNVFTDSLADIMEADAKKGTAKRMDYDPLADAEEWEMTDLRVTVRPLTPTTALGNVSFSSFGETNLVNIDLVKTKAGWRIDDLQVPDGRLRQLFEGPDPVAEAPISGAPVESRAATGQPAR
jgi:hypothetical protein